MTGGIPRERKQELVRFKWRQYSLDERRFFKALSMGFYYFMDKQTLVRFIIALVVDITALAFLFSKFFIKRNIFTTKLITRVALFSAISSLLYIIPYLKFALPFFPSFLEIHFDEIPAMIAGFAYGPFAGFLVILIKTIIKLPFSSSLCVGELADFIYGSIMVIVSSLFYKKNRSFKGAIIGVCVATLIQLITSGFVTTFLILDFYIFIMGFPKQAIIAMSHAANPLVNSLGWDFFLFIAIPFNGFKDIVIVLLTLVLYKKTHVLIDKASESLSKT